MRHFASMLVLGAVLGLAAPAAAQERTDWSVLATYKASGKVCALRFSVPRDGFTVTLDNRSVKGKGVQAGFTIGGLPAYFAASKAVVRNIRFSVDGRATEGITGDWRKGSDERNSRISFTLPFGQLLSSLSAGQTLQVDVPVGQNVQSFTVSLNGAAAPAAGLAACLKG